MNIEQVEVRRKAFGETRVTSHSGNMIGQVFSRNSRFEDDIRSVIHRWSRRGAGFYLNAAFLDDAPKRQHDRLTVASDGLLIIAPAETTDVTYRQINQVHAHDRNNAQLQEVIG